MKIDISNANKHIKKELCIKNANKNVALSDLIDPYANSYTDDEMDEGLTVTKTGVPAYVRDEDSVIFDITIGKLADESQNLNNPVDVRNAIFLDVVIKGMPVVAAAKKYTIC